MSVWQSGGRGGMRSLECLAERAHRVGAVARGLLLDRERGAELKVAGLAANLSSEGFAGRLHLAQHTRIRTNTRSYCIVPIVAQRCIQAFCVESPSSKPYRSSPRVQMRSSPRGTCTRRSPPRSRACGRTRAVFTADHRRRRLAVARAGVRHLHRCEFARARNALSHYAR